jgi:hypothetical protein
LEAQAPQSVAQPATSPPCRAKLRGARERKKAATGKCEGRKSWAEMDPAMVEVARQLRKTGKSLNAVRTALAQQGFVSSSGKPFTRSVVSRMAD